MQTKTTGFTTTALMRTFLRTTSEGFWLTDNVGRILEVNQAYETMSGYVSGELVGMLAADLDVDDGLTEMAERVARIHRNGSEIFETRHRRKDGSVFAVEMSVTLLPRSGGQLVCLCRDITFRKQAEETLRANEAEFRKLIRALPLPLAIINRSGEHTYINERFTQLFGYSYADIPTRDLWRQAAFPDETYRKLAVQAWKEAVDRVVDTQADSEQIEFDITCKNGSVCSVIVSCSLLGEDVIATFTDISERQRREQVLKVTYERRRKSDLMNELIQTEMPTKRLVHESARLFGAKMMQPFSCFLIMIDTYQGQAREDWQKYPVEYQLLLEAMLDALEASNRIVWDSPDGIGILWFDSTEGVINIDQQKTIAMTLCDILADKIPAVKVSIGIAEAATDLSLLSSRYHQARLAANTGRKVWPRQPLYHYLELGVFQLLADVTNETRSDEYIDRMLGKLLRYDKQKRDAYLTTLENILMSDNLKASADKLAIHYHTLMFRKQRLEQILEVSFDDFAVRLSILNALHLLKLRKK